jgi:spermidine synthase
MNAEPKNWRPDQRENLMSAAPAVANSVRPNAHFAIIGPGGGVDVLRAVGTGSRVTGIEINPIIVNNIMRGRYADFAHHLYEIPEVDIHVSDGRSFVRNSPGGYDALQMTLVDTWASTAAGAFALSENNLYTTNAFREYFDHLKPDGMLAITRWEFKSPREALRVVSQAITVLQQLGVRETSNYFIIVSDGALKNSGCSHTCSNTRT